jgi:hypothetical protein
MPDPTYVNHYPVREKEQGKMRKRGEETEKDVRRREEVRAQS